MVVLVAREGELLGQGDYKRRYGEAAAGRASRMEHRVRVTNRDTPAFMPIGRNLPLIIRIAHVYTGRYPGNRARDMLLTSAIKSYSVFDVAPRAVNFLSSDVARKTPLVAPTAVEQGTSLIFYSPGVTDDSLTLALELGFDKFPSELFSELGSAFQSVSGLPIFLPFAGFLMIGAQISRLIGNVGEKLFETSPEFARTETLDFNLAGFERPEAAFRIIANPSFDTTGLTFVPKRGLVLKSAPEKLYDGDEPYIILSMDGRASPNLVSFTPTLASAELLASVFGAARKSSAVLQSIVEAASLANDVKFRLEADRAAKSIAALESAGVVGDELDTLKERLDALIANIGNDLLKPPQKDTDGQPGPRDMHTLGDREPGIVDPGHDAAAAPALPHGEVGFRSAPRTWRIAKSLLRLRQQIDEKYPNRNRASDGTIGDANHATRASDHNPWVTSEGVGVVTAIDVTHDPDSGCDAGSIIDALVASKDSRIKYIIYNREIINSSSIAGHRAWACRPYSGQSPHTKHFHLSVLANEADFDDQIDWSIS